MDAKPSFDAFGDPRKWTRKAKQTRGVRFLVIAGTVRREGLHGSCNQLVGCYCENGPFGRIFGQGRGRASVNRDQEEATGSFH